MTREFSAGGVVVRRKGNVWRLAAIQPAGKEGVWALPKGAVDRGERPVDAAVREVAEETGLTAVPLAKLGDVRYVYTWRGERVFKVVSFFLLRATHGRLGRLPEEHAHEVARTRWVPLEEVERVLTYPGERAMAFKAREHLEVEPAPEPL